MSGEEHGSDLSLEDFENRTDFTIKSIFCDNIQIYGCLVTQNGPSPIGHLIPNILLKSIFHDGKCWSQMHPIDEVDA